MKKYWIVAACIVLFLFWYYRTHPLSTQVQIRGQVFTVDLAVTPEEQAKGLGYRTTLAKNRGMLFLYQGKDRYSYWMKGMNFPIDIIWIRDNNIVDITKNVPVATTSAPPIYTPKEPVNKVLEVNAGIVDTFGIEVGDIVQIVQ